ncbi:MAG: hypothetical protein KC415_10860, partial [Anaerolineales bacterium]|nr:hypothetical protein [Anaerolineales bacterium]
HVMRIFSAYGHNRFVLALGHMGDQVRRYFLEYEVMTRDTTIHLAGAESENGRSRLTFGGGYEHDPWEVTMVDTGLETGRAARLLQLEPYLGNGRFFVAYGEAVANINLRELEVFHTRHGKMATVTGIRFASQYGKIEADADGTITEFQEKPELPYWVNGGFMLFEPEFMTLIRQHYHENLMETDLMPDLMAAQNLMLYRHNGYWQSMKTLKDALKLKDDWQQNQPWKVW